MNSRAHLRTPGMGFNLYSNTAIAVLHSAQRASGRNCGVGQGNGRQTVSATATRIKLKEQGSP